MPSNFPLPSPPPDGIFVSCVSRELHGPPWAGSYRKAVADYLDGCGLRPVVQERFTQSGTGTLAKLYTLMADECKAVVHLIRRATGDPPPADDVRNFLKDHDDFLADWPTFLAAIKAVGFHTLSYTQWEAVIAIHLRLRLFVYRIDDSADPAPGYVDDADQAVRQAAHADRLKILDHYAEPAHTPDRLVNLVGQALHRNHLIHGQPPEPKPLIQNLPYKPLGRLFKGRDAFLKKIEAALRTAPTAVTAAQAIHGAGGIGKTRAAVEYAWAHRADYDAMLFVIADSAEKVDPQLANLAGVLNVAPADAKDAVRLASVIDWLKSHDRWLLIVDNVDDDKARDAVYSRLVDLANGHVLITSRWKEWPDDVQSLSLELLAMDDAISFLLDETNSRRRHAADDPTVAKAVATAVGRLSLGLTHARSYVSKFVTTYAEYLDRYKANDAKVKGWFDPKLCKYPREIAVTWQISVDQLSAPARRLLDTLSWFGPEPIPESVLAEMPADVAGRLPDTRELLIELNALSLAEMDDVDQPTFWVHRLIQDVTRRKQSADQPTGAPPALADAAAWLDAAFHGDPSRPDNWPQLRALSPHAVATSVEADHRGHLIGRCLHQAAYLAQETGDCKTAEPLYRQAWAISERTLGPGHPDTLTSINNLACLLLENGDLTAAEPLIWRVYAAREQASGPDHPNTLKSVNNLACLMLAKNDLEAGESIARRALARTERVLGILHPSTLCSAHNLGRILTAKGDFDAAYPMCRWALSGCERVLGPNHPNTLRSVWSFALLLQAQGYLPKAEPLYRRAVIGMKKLSDTLCVTLPALRDHLESWYDVQVKMGLPPAEVRLTIANAGLLELLDRILAGNGSPNGSE